jgi:hypothetical protein
MIQSNAPPENVIPICGAIEGNINPIHTINPNDKAANRQ